MAEAVSRMTGKPGLCIGTLGPGIANLAGAMHVRQGRELAGHLPRRPARAHHRAARAPRPHPVRLAGGAFRASVKYAASIEYADQTDEIIRHAHPPRRAGRRVRSTSSIRRT